MRIEEDSVGKMEVPDKALYGIHALRAFYNFPITNEKVQPVLIKSLIQIKKAAAITNRDAKTLDTKKAAAIILACDHLLNHYDRSAFIVPAIQGGAGTSTNMNVNEVIANLAMRLNRNDIKIHPNDDVNQCQSTNDTYPTAGKIAMLSLLPSLIAAINKLIHALKSKAKEYQNALKVGRTQLQDAVPTTFGNSFNAYASMFHRDLHRLNQVQVDLKSVNLGGTAIGTGINTSSYYTSHVVPNLSQLTGLSLYQADNLIDATQNSDSFVEFSSVMKALAVNLSKMSNDLRLMTSGPQDGLNEINLPKRQAGSSIMPGKINPVIPEVVNQVAFEVIGKDTTITMAAEAGQLELNAFEPIMFRDILISETHLTRAIETLVERCINGITVNKELDQNEVSKSAITATVLSPYLGYETTTKLIKTALKHHYSVKQLVSDKHLLNDKLLDHLFSPAVLTNAKIKQIINK
ncbi:aspartate ammonia-lyase [Philodulcilactobacillus myokoensis]|uniref:Aspartate ammonia-lyase n=1 Tax=Philodulcilactobacillus myokoensis TaxID=2929573 RepID=A0A9W6EST3_9LACO|nr:aspartate ammonia-lyase [Philodulcilactobacillus myokoensis]GLB46464.1 aspartate ammonia-lyase [Philodulcilactobacillus myokoensis]